MNKEDDKIYLIANCPFIDKTLFTNIKSNDVVIQINKAIYNNYINCCKENKLLFMRANKKTWWGYEKKCNDNYKKCFFMTHDRKIYCSNENNNNKKKYMNSIMVVKN